MASDWRTLKPHALADELPGMRKEEYEALKQDIQQNGLKEPMILFKRRILDGRHRHKACVELDIDTTDRTQPFAARKREVLTRHGHFLLESAAVTGDDAQLRETTRQKTAQTAYVTLTQGQLDDAGASPALGLLEVDSSPLLSAGSSETCSGCHGLAIGPCPSLV